MKKHTFLKNNLRDIRDTKGKILSIFIMIFLASSVIVGLVLTGASMRKTLNKTLKTYDHPDLTVSSTYGLNDEDKVIIENDKDIDHVYYSKIYDGFVGEKLLRIKSFSEDTPKVGITVGRYPKYNDEIVLDEKLKDKYKIGDVLKFKSPNNDDIGDSLAISSYKLVGFATSSEYLFQDIRDVSITGKKMTDGFALVKEENFKKDILGQANIYYKEVNEKDLFDDEYTNYIKDKKKNLEESLEDRPEKIIAKIKKDANKEIKDSEEKLDKSEKELLDKESELIDAKKSLEKGFSDYEKGKKEFYDKIEKAEKDLQTSKAKLDDGRKQLEAGKIDYKNSKEEFNKEIKAKSEELEAGKKELEDGQIKLDEGKKTYEENLSKLEAAFSEKRKELELLGQSVALDKENLEKSKKELESQKLNLKELEKSLENMEPTSPEYSERLAKIEEEKLNIQNKELEIENKSKAYEEKLAMYELSKKEFDTAYGQAKKPLDEAKAELDKNQAMLDQKKKELEEGENLLEQKKNEALSKFDQAEKELSAKEKELNDGLIQYEQGLKSFDTNKKDGEAKLKSSYAELIENLDKYKKGKKEFDEKTHDARKEIDDGKEKLAEEKKKLVNLKNPVYDVGYNKDNKAIKTYYNNSLNIDELTKVFPTFFYFVAILVTLTTMKRYIEEQRSHVGTLKSLGYTNRDIANKFYLYGLLPTLFGAIFGSIFGKFILTKVIFTAYSTNFNIMDLEYYDSLFIIFATVALSLFLIYLTIFITNRKSVNEVTANLLRGKVPKQGSRIFLERIGFIWKRLSFMKKVTFRNIFRYKSRMYMTLFGVAGCTALIFFGFAMQDAITDTSNIQRDQLTKYDAIVVFDTDAEEKELKSLNNTLDDMKSSKIVYKQVKVEVDDKDTDVNLMAFEDENAVKDFINIRDANKNHIKISKSGAIITDNLAKKNRLKLGDKLDFEDEDKNSRQIEIIGIAENYVNDYIYISKDDYERVFDKDANYNASLLITKKEDDIKELEKEKSVLTIVKPNTMYETIDVLMDNLNLVIVIITLVSSLLAIVVLFNLTNINVSERMRELATTKVLGFYPKETTAYIYRETFILTIIGIIFGYLLGYVMFRYVLNVVAPEGILIAYKPHLRSFVIAAMITFLISLVIMVIVHRQLKSIDMAEAMKSGE